MCVRGGGGGGVCVGEWGMGREGRGVKNYGGLRDTAIMGKTNENFQMSPTVSLTRIANTEIALCIRSHFFSMFELCCTYQVNFMNT